MKFKYLYTFLFIISTISLSAQEIQPTVQEVKKELVTDRPDQTESAVIVPKNSIQVETGFMFENNAIADNEDNKDYTFNTTLIRVGLNEHIELRVIQEYLANTITTSGDKLKTNGFSPLSIGAKLKIAKARKWVPEMAFLGHLTFPTGSKSFDQTQISGDFRFSFEYDLSEKFSLGINLGGETDGETPNMTGIYTLVVGYAPINWMGIFVESYGFITHKAEMPHDHRFNAGLTFSLTDMVQYDVSGGVGLSENSTDFFIATGISFRVIN